jgi:fimbrial chaperone protein
MFLQHAKTLISKTAFFAVLASVLLSTGWPAPADAGIWRVAPIKLFFDTQTRSDVVTVTNDGDQPLALVITAVQWSQDQEGQDLYQPATDLVFFPKQLTIEPHKERVIRTGVKVPAVSREKTYRLFIKEIPDRRQSMPNTVAIAIQFGVPIFAKPVQENIAGAIAEAKIAGGSFAARIENQGNSHFRISTIALKGLSAAGEILFQEDINGWYLLSGSTRTITTPLSLEICQQLDVLDIQVNADRTNFNGQVDVEQTMCSAP